MKKLDTRMKLYHINDRGTRLLKPAMTPILKSDSMELGCGNMNLDALIAQAKAELADGGVAVEAGEAPAAAAPAKEEPKKAAAPALPS